ncbi:MAG: hypothetical protein JO069_13555 [Verrucomicrobia bacterium]|nr:hypothetical protein [Verrucomicrobiota bacterium]
MTMFSVYVGDGEEAGQPQELTFSCRLDRALSNLEARVLVVGTTREDVIGSGGRVLIPAGAKVVGQGFCDAERARFLGRGRWTCFAGDHQISAEGVLLDGGRKEGLEGTENTDAAETVQVKEAIYRDGIFLYVPAGSEFLLRLQGNVSVQELGSAAER